jgi:IclR family transcriptional regulator, acetate operon repressor
MVSRGGAEASLDGGHRAVARVLDILETLSGRPAGASLTELSVTLEAPKTSLLPLLRTLVSRGYAARGDSGRYGIGPRWLEAADKGAVAPDLVLAAHPVLQALTRETGETTFVAVLPPGHADLVYVDKVESPQRIRYSAELGERRPLYCTATGFALFAFLEPARREHLVRTLPLARHTRRTTTSRDLLRRRLDAIHAAGVAVTVDEFVIGAGGAAAPVYGRDGRLVAACAVTGPTARIHAGRRRFADAVKRAAAEISERLGHHRNEKRAR